MACVSAVGADVDATAGAAVRFQPVRIVMPFAPTVTSRFATAADTASTSNAAAARPQTGDGRHVRGAGIGVTLAPRTI